MSRERYTLHNSGAGLMSIPEAAIYLGKSESALRGGYKKWEIPYMKLGGQVVFSRELLDEWLKKKFEVDANKDGGEK